MISPLSLTSVFVPNGEAWSIDSGKYKGRYVARMRYDGSTYEVEPIGRNPPPKYVAFTYNEVLHVIMAAAYMAVAEDMTSRTIVPSQEELHEKVKYWVLGRSDFLDLKQKQSCNCRVAQAFRISPAPTGVVEQWESVEDLIRYVETKVTFQLHRGKPVE